MNLAVVSVCACCGDILLVRKLSHVSSEVSLIFNNYKIYLKKGLGNDF